MSCKDYEYCEWCMEDNDDFEADYLCPDCPYGCVEDEK